jgi:hypothetical protein
MLDLALWAALGAGLAAVIARRRRLPVVVTVAVGALLGPWAALLWFHRGDDAVPPE